MPGDHIQFQKPFPLTASKNPQLPLFPDTGDLDSKIRHAALFRKLWSAQKRKFARFSSNGKMRSLAASADRFRDHCRHCPVSESYPWEWSAFGLETVYDGAPESPTEPFSLTGLQTRQQRSELLRLFEEISQHIAHALSRPSPVFADRYAVRVEFLDCFAWVALKVECELYTEIRDQSGEWQMSVIGFDMMKPLHTPFWISLVLLPWAPQIVKSFGEGAQEAYGWLREKLAKRFQNDRSLAGLRRQVAHHMNVAPGLTSSMLHIRKSNGDRIEILNSDYGKLWAAEPFWSDFYNRHHGLLLFYHHSVEFGLISEGDDVGKLREACLQYGMSAGAWRFLAREGEASYRAAVSSCVEAGLVIDNAICLVEWQCRAGLRSPLPHRLAEIFIIFAGMMLDVEDEYCLDIDPRIARVAVDHWSQLEGSSQKKSFAEEDWIRVLAWLRDVKPQIDRNQWRSGWPAIWRLYRTWELLNQAQYRWNSSVGEFVEDGLLIRPLTSSCEVTREGIRMRHCVSSYAERCHKGSYRLFSVVDAGSGKNLATVGLKKEDQGWKLSQAKGKLNKDVDKQILELSRALAKRYDKADVGQSVQPRSLPGNENTLHVKVSGENGGHVLLARAPSGEWAKADPENYPIPDALREELREFSTCLATLPQSMLLSEDHWCKNDDMVKDLTGKLRKALPAEFVVYAWDVWEFRDVAIG